MLLPRSPITYRVCTIKIFKFRFKERYRPIIENFRGTEVIKVVNTYPTEAEAITAAKTAIDKWLTANKGVV